MYLVTTTMICPELEEEIRKYEMKCKIVKHWDCGKNSQIFQLESKSGHAFEVSLSKHHATVLGSKEAIIKLFGLPDDKDNS